MPLGNLELVFLCVSRHLNYLHAVPQGGGNGCHGVGSCNKEHLHGTWQPANQIAAFVVTFIKVSSPWTGQKVHPNS